MFISVPDPWHFGTDYGSGSGCPDPYLSLRDLDQAPDPVRFVRSLVNVTHSSSCGFCFTSYKDLQRCNEKIRNRFQMVRWTFFDCHHSYTNRISYDECFVPLKLWQRMSCRQWLVRNGVCSGFPKWKWIFYGALHFFLQKCLSSLLANPVSYTLILICWLSLITSKKKLVLTNASRYDNDRDKCFNESESWSWCAFDKSALNFHHRYPNRFLNLQIKEQRGALKL
jgi:hypothetical protein